MKRTVLSALVLGGFVLSVGSLRISAVEPGAAPPQALDTRTKTLSPTATAPADAGGSFGFQKGAGQRQILVLQTHRLRPGTYRVRAELATGVIVTLAPLQVSDPTRGPERVTGTSTSERQSSYPADVLQSRTEIELPQDIAVNDIRRIIISDLADTAWLVSAP